MATTTNGNLERGDYKNVALEEEDVVEMKKQLATGSSKETHQSVSSCECFQSVLRWRDVCSDPLFILCSTVAPIACYCAASILMTVVNKVRPVEFGWTALQRDSTCLYPTVRRVRTQFLHELPAAMHTIFRLRGMRLNRQEIRYHLHPRLRCAGRKGVVPHQLPPRHRHLHRFQESSASPFASIAGSVQITHSRSAFFRVF